MENRFHRELSRRLAEEGISTDQPGEKGLPVLLDSRPAVFISASGLAYMPGEGGEEERELYHKGGLCGARGTRSKRAAGYSGGLHRLFGPGPPVHGAGRHPQRSAGNGDAMRQTMGNQQNA